MQLDIAFGAFRLDLTNECLWQGARSIPLRPKAFAVLRLLLEHPGQLVNKQQLLDAVWPDAFVGDAVLKDNIRHLREVLGDNAGSPTFIETAHRRGYRFIGKLSEPAPKNNKDTNATGEIVPSVVGRSGSKIGALGREAEFAKMQGWLDRALAGDRQIVFVTGEPGIGKTTVVRTFLERAAQIPGVRVARGQCMEHYGSGEAYLPVLDGFSRLCRSPGGAAVLDLLHLQAPAWLAQMPSLVPPAERERMQSQSTGATRERMLREMAEAIETLSAESPLLLILEDLHWSDYSTLDLVSYLARRRDFARLMVIGTYRPVDVILSDHPLKGVKRELQAHSLCHELPLEYLTEEAVAQYLTARFPNHHLPGRLRRTIYQRTEGNPLFMVNLVEYFADQKVIAEEEGTWTLRGDLADVEQKVPSSLRDLIERQIERLSPDERTVLEGASVAGLEFSSVAVAAGLDRPVEWVEKHCEELARRHQFLSASWLGELPNGTTSPRHRFKHILYLEVPYSLVPQGQRAQIHHRIAEQGVAIYGDRDSEIAAELAMHFERSRDWPRALQYLLQAAENAAARSASHEAIDLANRGLEALGLLPETAEHAKQEMKLRMILSVSLTAVKGFASPEVETINARGRALFWRQGPSPELFYMLWSLNLYQQFSGEMHTSLESCHLLMQLAEDLRDGALIIAAHNAMGAVLTLSGRCSEGLEHVEKGRALSATYPDQPSNVLSGFSPKVMLDCFAAMALWALGYPAQSAEKLATGLALARELGHPQTLTVAGHVAAQLHQLRGETSLAYERAKEAMDLADEYGLEVWLIYGSIELGWAEAELGDVQVGIAKMQQGLAAYEATGAKLRSPYFLGLLADQLCKAGRVEEGLAVVGRATTLAERTGESYSLPELYRLKGELIVKKAQMNTFMANAASDGSTPPSIVSEAEACFAQAIAIAKQQGTKSWELRATISMYRLQLQMGKPNHTQLAEANSWFTEGHETADLKEARGLLKAVSVA